MTVPGPHARWLEIESDRLLRFARGAKLPAGGFGVRRRRSGRRPAHVRPVDHVPDDPRVLPCHAARSAGWRAAGRPRRGGTDGAVRRHRARGLVARGRRGLPSAGQGPQGGLCPRLRRAGRLERAARRPTWRRSLAAALDVVDRHFWDESDGRVRESWDAAFEEEEPYRGANSSMHSVEAFLAAADTSGDPVWRTRALRIADWLINDVARHNGWRVVEHFHLDGSQDRLYNVDDPAHQYRPYGATIGHALEWSRLLLHLRAALGAEAPAWLLEAAIALFDTAISSGWAVDGADGFVYTVDWDGSPVVRERLHWVVAEAIGGAAALAQVTGRDRYAVLYEALWDHVAARLHRRAAGLLHPPARREQSTCGLGVVGQAGHLSRAPGDVDPPASVAPVPGERARRGPPGHCRSARSRPQHPEVIMSTTSRRRPPHGGR